jgi:small-conductance mechanosensitive channel
MKRLLREYRIELIALGFVLLGWFLLVERIEIRATIFRVARQVVSAIGVIADRVITRLVYEATHITMSDAIGLILIALAFVILVWRVRYRLRRSPSLTEITCPVCGGELRRVRRTLLDRVISQFVPVRRYRCKNLDCRWTGLRVRPA